MGPRELLAHSSLSSPFSWVPFTGICLCSQTHVRAKNIQLPLPGALLLWKPLVNSYSSSHRSDATTPGSSPCPPLCGFLWLHLADPALVPLSSVISCSLSPHYAVGFFRKGALTLFVFGALCALSYHFLQYPCNIWGVFHILQVNKLRLGELKSTLMKFWGL